MPEDQRTSLYDVHVSHGARIVSFAGWKMPISYSGISKEHVAVRTAVGLFDVSHMGEFFVRGERALDLLQLLTLNDVSVLVDGQAQYSAMVYPDGGLVDDLLVYRLAQDEYMLVVNAGNVDKDLAWIESHNEVADVEDRSARTALLAIQGPRAPEVLQPLTDLDLSTIRYYRFARGQVAGVDSTVSRTGYTGEDGFECYFNSQASNLVWKALLESGRRYGILPAGLGARNTLRLEAGMLLYGNDIDQTTTPIEAGLGWITKLDKGEFIGRESLVKQRATGIQRKLVGFEMTGREIARDHYPVLVDDRQVGQVTSGGPSITLKKNIGLAYLPIGHTAPGSRFQVQIRGRKSDAEVVKTPFYKRRSSV